MVVNGLSTWIPSAPFRLAVLRVSVVPRATAWTRMPSAALSIAVLCASTLSYGGPRRDSGVGDDCSDFDSLAVAARERVVVHLVCARFAEEDAGGKRSDVAEGAG